MSPTRKYEYRHTLPAALSAPVSVCFLRVGDDYTEKWSYPPRYSSRFTFGRITPDMSAKLPCSVPHEIAYFPVGQCVRLLYLIPL